MQNAIEQLINIVIDGIYTPLVTALNNTTPFTNIISFINHFLNSFFKFWNNENSYPTISNELIAEIIAMLFIIALLSIIVKVFIIAKNVIGETLTPSVSQQVTNKINKKKKKSK